MFSVGQYISLENMAGLALTTNIYRIMNASFTSNTVRVFPALPAGTYHGGGVASLVSNIGILSKQWNPYVNQDRNFYLARIDFGVESTESGEVFVAVSTNASSVNLIADGVATGAVVDRGILQTRPYDSVPYEQHSNRLWHPVYFQADGQCVQIVIGMTNDQMLNSDISWSDFQIEGMALYTTPTSSRLQ
jgi:hypothetical protein